MRYKYILIIIYYFISFKYLGYIIKKSAFTIINCIYGQKKVNVGKNTKFAPTVIIRSPENVYIGDNCYFNHNTMISAGKTKSKIIIGNNVLTGPNVILYSYNHSFNDSEILIKDQGYIEKDVIIEDDVWIGANSVILPGTLIRRGAVIGAGSIVTGELPPYSINVGTKAKTIKHRGS